jgi:transposase
MTLGELVPALPSWLTTALWDQFAALLPQRPTYHPDHPLGCHRRRVADRVIFDKLVQVLVFGCGYRKIADQPARRPPSVTGVTSGSPWASSPPWNCWSCRPMTA